MMTDAKATKPLRRISLRPYLIAGAITWVVVTAMLYWGDRFMNDLPGLGGGGAPIGFWTAGGGALLLAVLIVLAGWLQAERS